MTQAQKIGIWAATAIAVLAVGAGVAYAATTEYASSVVSFSQGLSKGGAPVPAARSNPSAALGAPDGSFVSLGFGGTITLALPNYVGSNLSVTAYEITNGNYPLETANVQVSADGTNWTTVGTATNNSGSGPNPHTTTFSLPSGTCIKYVRLTDTSDPSLFTSDADGFDLDAVGATYDATCTPPTPPPQQPCGCNGTVTVNSSSTASVFNVTIARSSTGDSKAGGSYGGSGGSGGDVSAGPGLAWRTPVMSTSTSSSVVTNGTGGAGGTGGSGGPGGYVQTGSSTSTSGTINVINFNRAVISR